MSLVSGGLTGVIIALLRMLLNNGEVISYHENFSFIVTWHYVTAKR